MTDDDTMALLARVRWLEAQVEQLIDHAAQAEADRDTLAAEVRANRAVTDMAANHENNGQRWNLACKARRLAVNATDASGALTRAKAAK
jgi:hypothetical protein